ncbi:hypothetical protein J3998_03485 [Thiomicrorhabdus sp. 6S2-11]|uniref:Uncharacterized protein n=1 Tax=Thiomicrorhabdus marina TaxID=2818442 RepID=A0ABS3Q2T1_9GAMM|nr:hypothetical protein [Thiomicrorhabdus marina]MBO1926629.1 hypothetical protein [Thiomicrorhabdus marina]
MPFSIALLVTIHSWFKIGISSYIFRGFTNGRKVVRIKKRLILPTKKMRSIVIKYEKRSSNAWLMFIASFAFIVGMAIFDSKGQDAAKGVLNKMKSGTMSTVVVPVNGVNKSLVYLYCGARNCAAQNIENNEVVYFPQNGHIYVRQNKM